MGWAKLVNACHLFLIIFTVKHIHVIFSFNLAAEMQLGATQK